VFRWLFQFALILLLSVWVGSMVFFSAVVAPAVFQKLDPAQAPRFLADLFPRYYFTGTLCGSAALVLLLPLLLFDSGSRGVRLVQMLLVGSMLAGNLYAGGVLQGTIHRLGEERRTAPTSAARAEAKLRFDRLHRRSVTLNLSVLGLGVTALGTTATRSRKPA
jgi:hypothetical protein